MPEASYFLYSKLEGKPNAGIWLLQVANHPHRQPVLLNADLVEWVATPEIVGGGPTRLAVGPYQYTTLLKDEVIANNESELSRDWFLIPGNCEQYYLIAADPAGNQVWTAGKTHEPITVRPFNGSDSQQWTFQRAVE